MSGAVWVRSDDDTLEWGTDFHLDPIELTPWADQRDEAQTAMTALISALADAALLAQVRQIVAETEAAIAARNPLDQSEAYLCADGYDAIVTLLGGP